MKNEADRLRELEKEIALLPAGYISKKKINGSIKKYYQWTENGQKKSKYIDDETAADMEHRIDKRRMLQEELRELKRSLPAEPKKKASARYSFKTNVITGKTLGMFASQAGKFRKRDCFGRMEDYLTTDLSGKVFILYGLRRTGKTTLIKQALLSLSEEDLDKAAFI